MTRLFAVSLLLALTALVGGCAAVVVGAGAAAGYSLYEDRRSSGTQVDDQRIESRAASTIDQRFGWKVHVNVTSYNRQALITGEVPDAVTHAEIEKLVAAIPGVRALSNELTIGALTSVPARAGDAVTESGVVFLLGMVTEVEANAATEIARTTDGVKKVVRVFEYCKSGESVCRPIAPATAEKKPAA
jgi:osmotically-inducible protein OsmY